MNILTKPEEIMLQQLHPDLQCIFLEVLKTLQYRIASSTIRTKEQQAIFVANGVSKTLNSYHLPRVFKELGNKEYVCAIDILPLFENSIIDYKDTGAFCFYAGFIMCTADMLYSKNIITHRLRWGGDWNNNYRTLDEKLKDYGHFELVLV